MKSVGTAPFLLLLVGASLLFSSPLQAYAAVEASQFEGTLASGKSLSLGSPFATAFREANVPESLSEERVRGSVDGQVTHAGTGRALSGVQISIEGSGLGALTDASGRYQIADVPAGEVTVEAQFLGYGSSRQTIQVAAGETVTVDFVLREQALGLEEIVVTGVAGGTERRAVGHAVDRISASDISEVAPVATMSQLFSGRAPNAVVLPGSGMVGTGGVVRIRGTSSLSITSDPLIYVDGVRVTNDPRGGPGIRQGRQMNRLDDLNTEDIESVEIIKGPAAATLYGTEAANGVINIITKRGISGAPELSLTTRFGGNFLKNPSDKVPTYWGRDSETGELISVNLYDREKAAGRNFLQTGPHQQYDLSLRGGTDALRYFASASWLDSEGIVDYNWQERFQTRVNLEVMPIDGMRIGLNSSFLTGETRLGQAVAPDDLWTQVVWGHIDALDSPSRGFRAHPPEVAAIPEAYSHVDRYTWGLTLEYSPWDWLQQRVNIGVDQTQSVNEQLYPRQPEGASSPFGARGLGVKWLENRNEFYTTADYGLTAAFQLSSELMSRSSMGFQYYSRRFDQADAIGEVFPAPTVRSIGGAATTSAFEDMTQNRTVGVYFQEQLEWRNSVFLTGALRLDDNSAFGADFDAAVYPKFSATWVLHDEPFWERSPAFVDELRLRAAYGQSGMQPDVFDAVRLYTPTTGPGDAATFSPQSFGNPQLKPETSEEWEVGFDIGLLSDRFSLEATYYSNTTNDAIMGRILEPSRGFPGTQIVNIGQTSSWGYELSSTARIREAESVSWDLGFALGRFWNEVDDVGDIPVGAGFQQNRPGYPIGGTYVHRVVQGEFDPESGRVVNILCDGGTGRDGVMPGGSAVPCHEAPRLFVGPADPTWTGNLTSTLGLLGNSLRLYTMVEFRGGHHFLDGDIRAQHTSFVNSRMRNEADDPIFMAHVQQNLRDDLGMVDAGFAKLREVSLTYSIPQSLSQRFGTNRATVSLAGRNLATLWVAQEEVWGQPVVDPERRSPGSESSASMQTVVPPLSSIMLTVRMNF